jgi:uncharacterized protein (TIGR02466 family)
MDKIHHRLFSTPVSVFDVPDYEEINKHILPLSVNNEWGFREDRQIWNLKKENAGIQKLYAYFLYISAQFVNHHFNASYKPSDFELVHGWLKTIPPGKYQRPHEHGACTLAISYYVYVDSKTGEFNMYDPRGNRGWMGPQRGEFLHSERRTNMMFQHKPEIGQAIVMPAWLLHDTEMNKSDATRVSLVSNVLIREKVVDVEYRKFLEQRSNHS